MSKEIAVWSYMPGKEDFCENCVPRGCSCNIEHTPEHPGSTHDGHNYGIYPPEKNFKWIEVGLTWTPTDDLGREYPCCEYSYDENGIDTELEGDITYV
jgi:hypothetical protein